MKFDIINALRIAQKELGMDCDIRCRLDKGAFTIQMKVVIPVSYKYCRTHPQVYGQQFSFIDNPSHPSEDYQIDEMFRNALASLKHQIEGS